MYLACKLGYAIPAIRPASPVYQESVSGRQNDIADGYDTDLIRLARRYVGGAMRGSLDAGTDRLHSQNEASLSLKPVQPKVAQKQPAFHQVTLGLVRGGARLKQNTGTSSEGLPYQAQDRSVDLQEVQGMAVERRRKGEASFLVLYISNGEV